MDSRGRTNIEKNLKVWWLFHRNGYHARHCLSGNFFASFLGILYSTQLLLGGCRHRRRFAWFRYISHSKMETRREKGHVRWRNDCHSHWNCYRRWHCLVVHLISEQLGRLIEKSWKCSYRETICRYHGIRYYLHTYLHSYPNMFHQDILCSTMPHWLSTLQPVSSRFIPKLNTVSRL